MFIRKLALVCALYIYGGPQGSTKIKTPKHKQNAESQFIMCIDEGDVGVRGFTVLALFFLGFLEF